MKKNLILICLFELFVSVLPNLAEKTKVYYPKTAVGLHQKIGTLAAIQPFKGQNASQALILLPGLNSVGLSSELYEWRNFWNAWQNSNLAQTEKDKYKFFVLRYDGWDSLYSSSEKLETGLEQLLEQNPQIKSISFIGYSQGGLIPRVLLSQNPKLEGITHKIITFASPHQGAIVLTSKLVKDTVKTQSPILKAKNLQFLKVLQSRYRFAYLEQAWTNFDNGISSNYYTPPAETLKFPVPADKSKYIVYGSYYHPLSPADWEDNLSIFFGEIIPRLFLDRRAGTKELNRWMGKRVYPDEKPQLRQHLKLNDGVTPLVSALWGRMCSVNEKQPENWQKLFPTNNFCPSTPLQRAFARIDHLGWREAASGRYVVQDKLHPSEKAKTPYEWIIYDLISE